jgi:hypothetical protein
MNIDGPFYLKELVYNNDILKQFVSNDNVSLLIDIIFNYIDKNKICLEKTKENILKITKIITYFGESLLNELLMDTLISVKLIDLNKKILVNVVSFLKQHGGNLDIFEIYVSNFISNKKMNEHNKIEKHLSETLDKNNINNPANMFVNNEFINDISKSNVSSPPESTSNNLVSLQEQLTRLSKKYPKDLINNIVIEKANNPQQKYVIKKIEDFENNDNLTNCIEYLKSSILNNSMIENNHKKNTQEIIDILLKTQPPNNL